MKPFKTYKLMEIAELKRGPFGGALKKSIFVPDGYKVYEQKNAIYNDFSIGSYYISKEKFLEMKAFEIIPDDIIMSCSGTIGRLSIAPKEIKSGIINQALLRIRPRKEILPEYLKLYLESEYVQKVYLLQTSGTAMQNLRPMKVIKDIPIKLPDPETQLKILSKIKKCFTLLDKSEEKLINAEAKSQTLLDSILKKSLDINSAKPIELGEIANLINGDRGKNYPNKSALVKSGIPFITAGHIQNHKIDYEEMNYITEERYDILNSGKIQKDDILFCLRGSLGKIAMVEEANKGAIASSLVIIRPKTDIISKYLYYFLLSQYGQNQIREYDNGTAQPNLSASNLKKFVIRVPEISIQKDIIRQVEEFSDTIDTIKITLSAQRNKYLNLRQSILKKAFEGKLI